MSITIKGGASSDLANVNTDKELLIAPTKTLEKAGYVSAVAEVDPGTQTGQKLVRQLDVSPDFRLRTGSDGIWWDDTFNHSVLNLSVYQGVTSTMTMTLASGFLNLNAGNAVASGNVARLQTYRTFPLFGTFPLYCEFWLGFSNTLQPNSVHEFGLGFASGVTAPTDGVFFRVEGTTLKGVINNNGAEVDTGSTTLLTPVPATIYHFLIAIHNDRTEYWINDELVGSINTPVGVAAPNLSPATPLLLRQYNSGVVPAAIQTRVGRVTISQGDVSNNRLWSTAMVGNGQSAISAPHGATAGQTANYANSAAPASATLSNTAAGYTTLGGQWQFAAVAGAETDYALFAYQVPAGTAAVPGKNMMIRGINIQSFITGAAVATTATLLQWGLGVGSTAVSLATADSGTAGTRAPRRIAIGAQTFPVGSAIGSMASDIDVNFDTPLLVEAGTFFHVILKMPVGTATASQIVRGVCFINAYFE